MSFRAWPLALLAACSISWAGPDFDLMDTENGETLRLGEFRATVGARYYEQQDDSHLLSPRFGFDAGIGPWAELSLRYDYRILSGSPRFDDDNGSGDPVLRVKGMPWDILGMKAGASFTMKVPSATDSRGLGTDQVDFFGRIIVQKTIGHMRLSFNLGSAVVGDNDELSSLDAFLIYGLLAEYDMECGYGAFVEYRGAEGPENSSDISDRYPGNDWNEVRAGVHGPIGGGFQWQLDGTAGFGHDSPDYGAMLLISKEWGHACCDEEDNYTPLDPEDPLERPVRLAVYNPLVTDVADTMSPRQARFTTEFGAKKQADGSNLFYVPKLGGGFGIGPWADFELEDQVQYLDSDHDEFGEHVGLGSLFGQLRVTPLHGCHWRAGVIMGGKLPVGDEDDGLSTGEIDVYGKLVLSVEVGDLRVHVNAGVAINDDPFERGAQNDYLTYGLAAEYPLCKYATVVAEVEGSSLSEVNHNIREGWAGDNNHEVRAGVIGPAPFFKSWQWGLVGAAGLTDDSPDFEVILGFSTIFGEVAAHHHD